MRYRQEIVTKKDSNFEHSIVCQVEERLKKTVQRPGMTALENILNNTESFRKYSAKLNERAPFP